MPAGLPRTKAFKAITGLVVLVAISVAALVSIKAVDGAYSGNYNIVGYFTRAGEGLHPGSQVEVNGVQVGQVTGISLVDGKARVAMSIDHWYRVPVNVEALIKPVNLFGAEEVSLSLPVTLHRVSVSNTQATGRKAGTAAPNTIRPYHDVTAAGWSTVAEQFIPPGGVIRQTAVSDQLNQLFQAADPLLEKINATQLTNVISELNSATSGEGGRISSGIQATDRLAAMLSSTLPGQITALRSLEGLVANLEPTGMTIDSISASANQALPLFNEEEAAYRRLLGTLTTMSNSLATLISDYRPDIATLMESGANISRVLLTRESNVAQVIDGLEQFVTRIAEGVSPGTLPNGSHYAYFKSFITLPSLQHLLCGILSNSILDSASSLSSLENVLSALGNPLGCSMPATPTSTAGSTTGKAVSARPVSGTAASKQPAVPSGSVTKRLTGTGSGIANSLNGITKDLAQGIYGQIGAPSSPKKTSLGDVLDQVLGLL